MNANRCYDPDCPEEICFNPKHYNYICFNPDCNEIHCTDEKHYDKQLLVDYQKSTDLSVFDHREEIDYEEDVDISICGCPDCADDHDHDHDHSHGHEHDHDHHDHEAKADTCSDPDCDCHDHDHEHEHHKHEAKTDTCSDPDCDCHDHDHDHEHEHEHHKHEVKADTCSDPECGCHDHDHDDDDIEISICGCPDCADDDDHDHGHDHGDGDEELLAEGKPLIANRPIQIIVSSGVMFALGHILEFAGINPLFATIGSFQLNLVTIIFMCTALIAGYEIAKMAYRSLVRRHTVGPAMLMCIACVAAFIIGHPEEGAAVTFLYFIAEFLEDYAGCHWLRYA